MLFAKKTLTQFNKYRYASHLAVARLENNPFLVCNRFDAKLSLKQLLAVAASNSI